MKVIQDNSAVHTSRTTSQWYERHPRLTLLPHPPYSPDMNPIQNVWATVVRMWQSGQDRNRQALIDHALRSWQEIGNTPHLVENCVLSMPRRLQAVIDNEGQWTKY